MPTRIDLRGSRGPRFLPWVRPRLRPRLWPRLRPRLLPTLLLALCLFAQPVSTILAASLWIGTGDVSRPVWVDDDYQGLSPVWVESLGDGVHFIEVGARPGSVEWVRPWTARVTLSGEESVRVEVPSLQTLRILSSGRSVEVAIDGEPIGWTPLHLLVPQDRSLELRAGAQTPLLYRGKGSTDSTLVLDGPKDLGRAPTRVETSRSGLLLPLGAVAFGVLGAWARQVGDREYEDYLTTVDRERMQDSYDRAERYDDLAVGFWVGAEILLVASVWKWLRGNGPDHTSGSPLHMEIERPGELRLGVSLPVGNDGDAKGGSR